MTSVDQTVTQWIESLKSDDADAAEKLWERYFDRVVGLARRRLEGIGRTVDDEEDVALSVFKSLCLGMRAGRFPRLTDRDSLWSLLVAITVHKSVDVLRRENRKKRGGTGQPREADGDGSARPYAELSLSEIIKQEPTPEFAAQIGEQFDRLLARLVEADDSDLIAVAVLKMQGEANDDIARQMGCACRTVERKLKLIRGLWERDCQ